MIFNRSSYIKSLDEARHNHLIKIVTGLRRVGKSFLLFKLFREHLVAQGVADDHIISFQLDSFSDRKYRDPETLYNHVVQMAKSDRSMFYVMIDEVQMLDDFVDVLNGFLHIENVDVYVTGSNAKFLSSDVVTEFRGRGWQIHLQPLSFKEIREVKAHEDLSALWRDYVFYGGLPIVVEKERPEEKAQILKELIRETYISDIVTRNKVTNDADLEEVFSLLASNIGALTNPHKIAGSLSSVKGGKVSYPVVKTYIDYFIDSFLVTRAARYDIKGNKYIDSPYKYYFSDLGLRNSLLNFRQVESTHIMENIIFNHLLGQSYHVDVGNITQFGKSAEGKSVRSTYEVDFVCNRGSERLYVQSALSLPDEDKLHQETRSLTLIPDSFAKVVVTADNIPTHSLPNGILLTNIYDFLLK